MQESELNDLKHTIEGLIIATQEGQMSWSQANKTTFVWLNPNHKGRLILQRTGETARLVGGRIDMQSMYQLQAVDATSPLTGFTVTTDDAPDLKSVMHELFDVVGASITKKGISFLKSILPSQS